MKLKTRHSATPLASIISFSALSLVTTTSSLWAQGSLTPSSAPAPTMKTLTEIEPRTVITSLPFTISETGSYYLGTNAIISSADNGITISASNVTLDLNGYALQGSVGSLNGILISGTQSSIHIKNGFISNWGGHGIDTTSGTNVVISDVSISNSTSTGIQLGNNCSIKNSKIYNCSGDGIVTVGTGTSITNNHLTDNARGILLQTGNARVEDNECYSNSSTGINVTSDENTVINNKTIENGHGFSVSGELNHIANNYTFGNGSNAQSNQSFGGTTNRYDLLISDIPETLNVACNARLTGNVVNTVNNSDGIIIDADNVTLDLGGFSLFGSGADGSSDVDTPSAGSTLANYWNTGVNSDDGIVVLGSQENITIRNGSIAAWAGDGINALNADFSIFEDLHISYNDGDGLVTDFNCLIHKCTAHANGLDGLEGDDGTVVTNSSAGQNGDNGIQTSEGCTVTDCASFDNITDGFDVASGSIITGCTATDNGTFGFDVALGGSAINCVAYDNGSLASVTLGTPIGSITPIQSGGGHGFDMASSCILRNCHASLNEGHGVRTFANSYVVDCKFHENDFCGIRISSTDTTVENCIVTDNDTWGIRFTSSGSLALRNKAAGNVENYDIISTSSFGPIIDINGVGDISSVSGADHPQANYSY